MVICARKQILGGGPWTPTLETGPEVQGDLNFLLTPNPFSGDILSAYTNTTAYYVSRYVGGSLTATNTIVQNGHYGNDNTGQLLACNPTNGDVWILDLVDHTSNYKVLKLHRYDYTLTTLLSTVTLTISGGVSAQWDGVYNGVNMVYAPSIDKMLLFFRASWHPDASYYLDENVVEIDPLTPSNYAWYRIGNQALPLLRGAFSSSESMGFRGGKSCHVVGGYVYICHYRATTVSNYEQKWEVYDVANRAFVSSSGHTRTINSGTDIPYFGKVTIGGVDKMIIGRMNFPNDNERFFGKISGTTPTYDGDFPATRTQLIYQPGSMGYSASGYIYLAGSLWNAQCSICRYNADDAGTDERVNLLGTVVLPLAGEMVERGGYMYFPALSWSTYKMFIARFAV